MRKRARPIAPLPRDLIQDLWNKKGSGNRTPRKRFGDGAHGGRGHRRDPRAKSTPQRGEPGRGERRGPGRGSGGAREGPGPAGARRGCPLRIPRTCGRRPGGCGKVAGPLPGWEAAPPEGRWSTERHPQSPPRPSPLTLV
ncbi:myosin heavy chain IB-like [Haemorhous mexicanus]|uniref:myosin heavy chain IB-like n=1 Tax=Haemorhous mexicanus TaxID=30427 RepID=UPI0028BF16C0|nr:myosin heavy chain IB-like [Haemorhous mexicanus]